MIGAAGGLSLDKLPSLLGSADSETSTICATSAGSPREMGLADAQLHRALARRRGTKTSSHARDREACQLIEPGPGP
jgi:hypothetical protein